MTATNCVNFFFVSCGFRYRVDIFQAWTAVGIILSALTSMATLNEAFFYIITHVLKSCLVSSLFLNGFSVIFALLIPTRDVVNVLILLPNHLLALFEDVLSLFSSVVAFVDCSVVFVRHFTSFSSFPCFYFSNSCHKGYLQRNNVLVAGCFLITRFLETHSSTSSSDGFFWWHIAHHHHLVVSFGDA